MRVGAVNAGAAALEMVRSAVAASSTQQHAQVAVAKQALETMRLEGQAAVRLIESSDVGRLVDVRA